MMITVTERENPVDMVRFTESDRLYLNQPDPTSSE